MVKTTPYPAGLKLFNAWRAVKVTPTTASRNVGNRVLLGANLYSDLAYWLPTGKMKAPNLAHLFLGKRLVPDLGALWHSSDVAALGVKGWLAVSVSDLGVSPVVPWRSPSQVARIAANWIVAAVEGVQGQIAGRAVRNKARYARSGELPRLLFSGDGKDPVAESVSGPRDPRPAIVLASLFDLFPKPGFFFGGQLNHAEIIPYGREALK